MNTTTKTPVLDAREWDLVVELLESECKRLPVEIHHTRTAAFRDELRRRFEMAEAILRRLRVEVD